MQKRRIALLFFLALTIFPLAAQFQPFCSGPTSGFVVDFESYRGDIHATGFFSTICGKNTGYVAKWDGTQWVTTAQGGIAEGHALEVVDDALYIASYKFGTDSNFVLRWNDTSLTTIGSVFHSNANPSLSRTPSIYDIKKHQDKLVVCGEFTHVAGQPASGIASWNGAQWSALGSGLSGSLNSNYAIMYPHQMTIFEGDLIVCGNFQKAGGQTVNGIARWDGQFWHPLGPGFNDVVYGLGVFNGVLYAGGAFTASGGTSLSLMARWNGTAWENPGIGLAYSNTGASPFVHTIKQVGDSLFIAGGFNQAILPSAGTVPASGVVVLNNNMQINTLGGGVPPGREIEAIVPYNNGVLVGGGGPVSSGYIGFWNPVTTTVEPLFEESHAWSVYPNPAKDFFNLQGLENLDYSLLTLYDVDGKTRLQHAITHTDKIPLPSLANGVYWIQLSGSLKYSPTRSRISIMQH